VKTSTIVKTVLDFDVAGYVTAVRAGGRRHLDPALRGRMADLYVDLYGALADSPLSIGGRDLRVLRLAELALQSEWKLAAGIEEHGAGVLPGDRPGVLPEGPRGTRYQPYSNVRLLNHVLGTRRNSSDACIERHCRQALRFLVGSWLGYEQRSLRGTEPWGRLDPPGARDAEERLSRLSDLRAATAGWPRLPPAGDAPPPRWEDYLGETGRSRILEYLINLPQSAKHEENVFLRLIHLTEVTTSGILARTVAANAWLESGGYAEAVRCLALATELAVTQFEIMLVLRRTMSVESFLGFRKDTENASAIQMTSAQILQIHLLGVHPRKVEALGDIQENAFLLLYVNRHFRPLRSLLQGLPPDTEETRPVFAAAQALDEALFRWRRLHLGLAHRYLPKEAMGSGGTSGAPYLSGFYHDRIFDAEGGLFPHPVPLAVPPLDERVRARSVFSPLN
jgi:tryptophan 2,3-dioxygenase